MIDDTHKAEALRRLIAKKLTTMPMRDLRRIAKTLGVKYPPAQKRAIRDAISTAAVSADIRTLQEIANTQRAVEIERATVKVSWSSVHKRFRDNDGIESPSDLADLAILVGMRAWGLPMRSRTYVQKLTRTIAAEVGASLDEELLGLVSDDAWALIDGSVLELDEVDVATFDRLAADLRERSMQTARRRPQLSDPFDVEVVAEQPLMFLYHRPDASEEENRRATREWMASIMAWNWFWKDRESYRDGPAFVGYACMGCFKRVAYDVNAGGDVATCPECGERTELRPGKETDPDE